MRKKRGPIASILLIVLLIWVVKNIALPLLKGVSIIFVAALAYIIYRIIKDIVRNRKQKKRNEAMGVQPGPVQNAQQTAQSINNSNVNMNPYSPGYNPQAAQNVRNAQQAQYVAYQNGRQMPQNGQPAQYVTYQNGQPVPQNGQPAPQNIQQPVQQSTGKQQKMDAATKAGIKKRPRTGDATIDKMLDEEEKAIIELKRLDDSIPDEKLSAQIVHLEEVTTKIVSYVVDHPSKKNQVRKFFNYYLPTTIKLLNAYDRMDETGISGTNIDGTKGKVEEMMDTALESFDKQLDALYQDEALDISADIKVMQNMLAQEGLMGDDVTEAYSPTLKL